MIEGWLPLWSPRTQGYRLLPMLRHYWVLALFLSLIVSNPKLDFHSSTLAFIAKKSTLLLSFFHAYSGKEQGSKRGFTMDSPDAVASLAG
jgi:hypothetical protein